MSNENRDYPAWLDEELFAGLTEQDAPAETKTPREAGAVGTGESPRKKKKAKTAAPAGEKSAGEPKSGKKKSADEPGPKKKKAAAEGKKKSADEARPRKKKAAPPPADEAEKAAPTGEEEKTLPPDAVGESAPPPAAAAEDAPASGKGRKKSKKPPEESAKPEAQDKKGRQAKGRSAARAWLISLIVLVSLSLILCVGAAVCAYLITNSDTNLPNVSVGGVYVGGMTKEQALAALDEAKWDETRGGTLRVSLPEGVGFELDYLTAGAYEPKEEAVEAAFAYGHTPDMFDNLITYARGVIEPVDLGRTEFTIDRAYVAAAVDEAVDEFEKLTSGEKYTINQEDSRLEFIKGLGDVTLDRETICDKCCELLLTGVHELNWGEIAGEPSMPDFAAVAAELKREPVNAYYDPEADEIVPEVVGVELDTATVEKLWKNAGVLEKVSVPITIIDPEITEEGLREVLFHDKLGDCMTYIIGSTPNRKSNIRLACSRFDGMVLQPGESFSYNDVVGERTAEAGFKVAPVYSGTAHLDGLGGGICQVSSTLYNAALYANLEINERTCHTMTVGYLPLGLDATVDWPDTNFVFTNSRDYPIRIKAWVDDAGRTLTVEIWGTDVDGSYVDMLHYQWPAYDQTYRDQYGIDVQVGWGARTIRRTYHADGSYTDEDNVYSYYHIPEDEITWPVIETDYEEDDEG